MGDIEQNERLATLIEKREIYEAQEVQTLLGWKALLLAKYSDIETEVNLINEVLDGYGLVLQTDDERPHPDAGEVRWTSEMDDPTNGGELGYN